MSIPKSRSMDMVSSVDYELENLDFVELRKQLEEYVDSLLKIKMLSIDVLNNKSMKAKIISDFMDKYKVDYLLLGAYTNSIFENVIQCNILHIPIHTHIDLERYFKSKEIKELEDDEYLRQSLILMKV